MLLESFLPKQLFVLGLTALVVVLSTTCSRTSALLEEIDDELDDELCFSTTSGWAATTIGSGSVTVFLVLFDVDDKRLLALSLVDDEDEDDEDEDDEEEDCFIATGSVIRIVTTFFSLFEVEDEDDDCLETFLSEDDDCLESISAIANLVFSQGLEELLQSSKLTSVDDEVLKARASRFDDCPSIRWKVATQRLGSPGDFASLWGL